MAVIVVREVIIAKHVLYLYFPHQCESTFSYTDSWRILVCFVFFCYLCVRCLALYWSFEHFLCAVHLAAQVFTVSHCTNRPITHLWACWSPLIEYCAKQQHRRRSTCCFNTENKQWEKKQNCSSQTEARKNNKKNWRGIIFMVTCRESGLKLASFCVSCAAKM